MTTQTPFFFGFLTAADRTQAAMTWMCRQGIPTGIQKTEQLYAVLTSPEAKETYAWIKKFTVAFTLLAFWSAIWLFCQLKQWADNMVDGYLQIESLTVAQAWAEIEEITEEVIAQTGLTEEDLAAYEVPTITLIKLEDLEWNTLRSVAAQHGVKGRRKAELLQGLYDQGVTDYVL
jgi:hypothetical protein